MPKQQKKDIDLAAFSLSETGPVHIEMPPFPEATEDDIDAQLFTHIANAPKGTHLFSLEDLDDAWVQETYPGIQTMEQLRMAIKDKIEKESDYNYQSLKFALSTDALISRLNGNIPQEAIDNAIDEVRNRSEKTVHSFGESLNQYLREEGLSETDFELKIAEEAKHNVALNIALDKFIENEHIEVAEDELPQYLMMDDPDRFMIEVRESEKIEEAKHAASRVKAMRQLVETAEVSVVSE